MESDSSDEDVDGELSNWNLPFEDDATDFEPNTHADNSQLHITEATTAFEVLQKFISPGMIQNICEHTSTELISKGHKPVSEDEVWRFIAVNMAMGIVKLPAQKLYWTKSRLFRNPFFAETITRDRHRHILSSLRFAPRPAGNAAEPDRFKEKLGTFMTDLVKHFRQAFHPGEYLCLDESLTPFKGRLAFKQYNPKKRARFGIKLFILSDCFTKGILDILPYQGKSTRITQPALIKTLGFGGAAVVTMLEPYMDRGHRIVIDNWFNSPKLAKLLCEKKTYVLGTVQKRRKGMPTGSRMTKKLKKGEVEVFSNGKILIERWNDRREVYMLNSFLGHMMVDVETANPRNQRQKPGSVVLYNSKMGAVDDADKVIKPYESIRKSYVWYRKTAFHLIDLAVYNSFVLYKMQNQNRSKLPYLKYLENLIFDILACHPNRNITTRGRPTALQDNQRLCGMHFPEKTVKTVVRNGKSVIAPSKSRCVYCFQCRGTRQDTAFRCTTCQKRLCIGTSPSCFELYHSQRTLPKYRVQQAAPVPHYSSQGSSEPLYDIRPELNSFSVNLSAGNRIEDLELSQ